MSLGAFLAASLSALPAGPCRAQRVATLPPPRALARLAAPVHRTAAAPRWTGPRALPSAPRPALGALGSRSALPASPRARLPGPSAPKDGESPAAGPASAAEGLDRMGADFQDVLDEAGTIERSPADVARDAGGRIEDIVTGALGGSAERWSEPGPAEDSRFMAKPAGDEIRQAAEAELAAGDGMADPEPRQPPAPGRAAAALQKAGLEPETPWLSNLPWVSLAAALAGAGIYLGATGPAWVPGMILLTGGIALGGMVAIMGFGLLVALLSAVLRVSPPEFRRLGKVMAGLFYGGAALTLTGGAGVIAAMIAALVSRLS